MAARSDLIKSVEIKYFRSINNTKIKSCSSFNVITGPNDVGKSNILRALSLFFNNEAGDGKQFNFQREFSHKRYNAVRKESIKGRQFIQVTVEFNRGDSSVNTLPETFKVSKKWYRDHRVEVSDDIAYQIASNKIDTTYSKASASLQRFLSRIKFVYIPAIKDKRTFDSIFDDLQEAMLASSTKAGSTLSEQVKHFNEALKNESESLHEDFKSSTGIHADISLPISLQDLFKSFTVKTVGISGNDVALDNRGDGIRVRFIPAILNYISENSSHWHIWGFEEPENSMEFKRAFELSNKMRDEYSKFSQIFITTHSPAFINIDKSRQSIYIAKRIDNSTNVALFTEKNRQTIYDSDFEIGLAEDLGHINLLNKLNDKLSEAIAQAEEVKKEADRIIEDAKVATRPTVLTEGKTDPLYIREAWKRIYKEECPYEVISCNVNPEHELTEAAGADVLSKALQSIRADSPKITVGIFDRDREGIKKFTLDANFQPIEDNINVKIHKNKKSAAILIPTPLGMEMFATVNNLFVELLIPHEDLKKTKDGKGLIIDYMSEEVRVEGVLIKMDIKKEPHMVKIKEGKTFYANEILPTLPDESFENFRPLLESIKLAVQVAN